MILPSMLQIELCLHCSCRGSYGCLACDARQCRVSSLATSNVASTCMAHLLLLWQRKEEARLGVVKSICKDTGQGVVQPKVKRRKKKLTA